MRKIETIALILFLTTACSNHNKKVSDIIPSEITQEVKVRDLETIKEKGVIRVITDYNSVNYFVYKGHLMGYQYDLLRSFTDHIGIKLEVEVCNNLEETYNKLLNGDCDLIASNLAVTGNKAKLVNFTVPHGQTRQVLVQRKNNKYAPLLESQLELSGKTIHVQRNSPYVDRLRNLSEEIGDSIKIVEVNDYISEQLVALVATGEIDYTVCDENIARINQQYYPNLDIELAISFPQHQAWAVNKQSEELLKEINQWFSYFKETAEFNQIYTKYFVRHITASFIRSGYHSVIGGKVSDFDQLIRNRSKELDWDWRLVASIIFQESRFDPKAESWAGARGLMQLMPQTAEMFGVLDRDSPIQNIEGGLKFLSYLDDTFDEIIPNEPDKIKFILASYNVGPGHVLDAMRLAEKNGKDPTIWKDNVDYYVLNKSKPEFYNDPVVRHGYCNGEEPYLYVTEILDRYEHYKNILK